jgi:two-component system sensor histidine kinase UhpB
MFDVCPQGPAAPAFTRCFRKPFHIRHQNREQSKPNQEDLRQPMSLQTKLLILVTSLTLMLALLMVGREIEGTRRSVHEEIRTAHRVAEQLLSQLARRPLSEAAGDLAALGRIRAHETLLLDARGHTVYSSPQSPYKQGRSAPDWFAAWVTPSLAQRIFPLPDGGRLVLRADPSRAVVDGWDDFVTLGQWLALSLCVLGLLCWQLVRRALAPLSQIEAALRDIQQGRLETRLPPLPGREAKLMSEAFNDMAGRLQETFAVRQEARRARLQLSEAQEMAVAVQQRIEAERRHIARELHDEMGQQITAIRSLGLAIVNRAAANNPRQLEAAQLLVDTTAKLHDALRRIIPRLRPVALDRFGLRDALLDLIADCRLQAPSIHFEVKLPSKPAVLDEALSTALYRATQEALTNIVKHAGASTASITLRMDAHEVHLDIEDDGLGLHGAVDAQSGFGLLGMRERIDALRGRIAFEPAFEPALLPMRMAANGDARRGLRIAISVPLMREASA